MMLNPRSVLPVPYSVEICPAGITPLHASDPPNPRIVCPAVPKSTATVPVGVAATVVNDHEYVERAAPPELIIAEPRLTVYVVPLARFASGVKVATFVELL